jgi:hypothetical protein
MKLKFCIRIIDYIAQENVLFPQRSDIYIIRKSSVERNKFFLFRLFK